MLVVKVHLYRAATALDKMIQICQRVFLDVGDQRVRLGGVHIRNFEGMRISGGFSREKGLA